ncbi:MAG: hypothetical protein FWG22_00055 [Prolixibacteraceae bacterium]|nr:hypothetical protein [Prolixibacteraceae bacterium]
MAYIKSNRKGKGIHSPFAFKMVTEILFPKEKKDIVESYVNGCLPKEYRTLLILVGRIAISLGFEEIMVQGDESGEIINNLIRLDMLNLLCNKAPVFGKILYVWWSVPGNEEELYDAVGDAIFILANINGDEMRDFFNRLKEVDNVSQTFELKTHGIVVFGCGLQKEDYIIKGRKSY